MMAKKYRATKCISAPETAEVMNAQVFSIEFENTSLLFISEFHGKRTCAQRKI